MAEINAGNNKETPMKRLARIIKELKGGARSEKFDLFLGRLERVKAGNYQPVIKPLELYLDVVECIKGSSKKTDTYEPLLQKAEGLYDELFGLGEDTPGLEEKIAVYRELVLGNSILFQGFYDPSLFASFSDKSNYIVLAKLIMGKKYAHDVFSRIKAYGLEVREYLIDDKGYMVHLVRVAERLSAGSMISADAIIEEELLRVRRGSGLYDIDPVRLASVEKNVSKAAAIIDCGKDLLDLIEKKSRQLEQVADEVEGRAEEARKLTEAFLNTKTQNAKADMAEVMKEYEESQKRAIFMDKEIFLKQVFSDAESEINKYKSVAKTITASAAAEMQGLKREADRIIESVENAASNDGALTELLAKSRRDEDMIKLLEKLSTLKDVDIASLAKERTARTVQTAEVEETKKIQTPNVQVVHKERKEAAAVPVVSPLLDRNIPFKQRYALVMKEKERRMNNGELFHQMFDDVLVAVMENVNPYLIGPSGCGKTYMVKQVGELLGLDCTDIGYINEEYDILGYVTATGDYNESNFYRLYKYGGIAFCDELDNGNSKATVKLNSFLSNQTDSYYHFPGGEKVMRHANFRVIAAGNTDGNGADINYSTREKIEESVQQRMIPIYMGYDNRVEKAILSAYPDWFEFGCAFRAATDEWEQSSGIPAQGIFTTRDAFRIKQYLENGSFTKEKIMNYEFVQTKEAEYLGFLKSAIAKRMNNKSGAYDLYVLFADLVGKIRKRV